MRELKPVSSGERLKVLGIVASVVLAGLGMGYFSAAPNYAFQKKTLADVPPGFALIRTVKTGDLVNPVTWIKPTVGTYVFAKQEPPNADIFTVIIVPFDEPPSVVMAQVDCEAKEIVRAFPGGEGEPLIDVFAREFRTRDGKAFGQREAKAATPDELTNFCQRDWSKERQAGR